MNPRKLNLDVSADTAWVPGATLLYEMLAVAHADAARSNMRLDTLLDVLIAISAKKGSRNVLIRPCVTCPCVILDTGFGEGQIRDRPCCLA